MRLVTTMMTSEGLSDDIIEYAAASLYNLYKSCYKIYKFGRYKYDNQKFFEIDIDLFDVVFKKQDLEENLMKLILCYEKIMRNSSVSIDFISADDDTNIETV